MNRLQAIERILREAEQPLHADIITKRVLSSGLWTSNSKTPEDTISAALYSDIKHNPDSSPFVQVGKKVFSLREFSVNDNHDSYSVPREEQETNASDSTLYFLAAAEKVLDQFGNKEAMHYKEITDKAIECGWLSTSSKIPEATMSSRLATEINQDQAKGRTGRFIRTSRGHYALTKWVEVGVLKQINKHNLEIRKKLLSDIMGLKPFQFEELIGQLLVEMGFEDIEVTQASSDGGIDVRGTLLIDAVVRIKMAVQAKRWKNNVQRPIVQQVRGSLDVHEQGLIITTSKFSEGARNEATQSNKSPVALMDGDRLVELLMEYEIGVKRSTHKLYELKELPK